MGRYLKIAAVNLKFNLLPYILVAISICVVAPLFMGVKNLDNIQTAKILDVYISLIGIILLTPLFIQEQDKDIKDLIMSKKESISVLHIIRIFEAMVFLLIIVGGFLIFLKSNNCSFPIKGYYYGTIANCIFLGGLGILAYAIIDNLPGAYMVPTIYYIISFGAGKKYLSKFYLFSMMGGNVEDKKYLIISGIIMIVLGIYFRSRGSIIRKF